MYQEYQKADENITFTHIVDVKKKLSEDVTSWQFSTCFESTIFQWLLDVHKRLPDPNEPTESSMWCIYQMGMGGSGSYPPCIQMNFTVRSSDSNGNTLRSSKYRIDEASMSLRNELEHRSYWTEKGQFEVSFGSIMDEAANKEHIKVRLEIMMEFKRKDLENALLMIRGGAPVAVDLSPFYFASVTNRNRPNLKLKTSDGSQFLMTNKEVLWIASPFFRPFLQEETTEYTVEGATSLECIDVCITWLFTETYKKPASMTPKLAVEILNVIKQWSRFEIYPLKLSVEKHLYEELLKNHEDLVFVVDLLIVADNVFFWNLKESCIATILSHHFKDFLRTFVNSNHPLRERLNRDSRSLAVEVKAAFVSSSQVRSFIKFIPEHGED